MYKSYVYLFLTRCLLEQTWNILGTYASVWFSSHSVKNNSIVNSCPNSHLLKVSSNPGSEIIRKKDNALVSSISEWYAAYRMLDFECCALQCTNQCEYWSDTPWYEIKHNTLVGLNQTPDDTLRCATPQYIYPLYKSKTIDHGYGDSQHFEIFFQVNRRFYG